MNGIARTVIRLVAVSCLTGLPVGCDRGPGDGRIRASGSFEVQKVKIMSPAAGELESFTVEEGGEVKKGSIVAVIESEDLELKKEEILAALAAGEARLALVKSGARPEDIKQLKALTREVKLQKSLADTNLERVKNLHEKGSVSTSSFEEAETTSQVVSEKLTQVKWQLAKAKHGARDEEIDMAAASVAQLAAGLKQIEKMIADRTITSPVTGTIIETFVHEGELVPVGQLLATVADMGVMELIVYVSEKDLPRVVPGQKALVGIDAFEGRTFAGRVSHISDEAEFTPSTVQTEKERVKLVFEVKILVPNPEGYFKPGLPADVVFEEKP